MKVADLIRQMRQNAQDSRIIVPGRSRGVGNFNWPKCLTCGREPFSVKLEDMGTNRVEVRAKCAHKPYWQITKEDKVFEDSLRINIPIGTNRQEHISWALKNGRFFDPTRPPK